MRRSIQDYLANLLSPVDSLTSGSAPPSPQSAPAQKDNYTIAPMQFDIEDKPNYTTEPLQFEVGKPRYDLSPMKFNLQEDPPEPDLLASPAGNSVERLAGAFKNKQDAQKQRLLGAANYMDQGAMVPDPANIPISKFPPGTFPEGFFGGRHAVDINPSRLAPEDLERLGIAGLPPRH